MKRFLRDGIAVSFMAAALWACAKAGPPGSAMWSPPPETAASAAVESQPLQDVKPSAKPGAPAGSVTVAAGDTLYSIARAHGVPIRDLITWNGLDAPYQLLPGRVLRIPPRHEHTVAAGDTVYSISRRYGADMTALVRANGIAPPYAIKVGQVLKIPTESMPQTPVAPTMAGAGAPADLDAKAAAEVSGASVTAVPLPPLVPGAGAEAVAADTGSESKPQQTAALPPAQAVAPSASGFSWPLRGKLLSAFGAKKGGEHNDGINIQAARGAPVAAAADGTVIYAGNELRGFGNLVLIKHSGGWTTAYAHNESLLVKKGDTVTRGETVAKAGSTGSVASPQVHFELRRGTRAVNPLDYLGGTTNISAK